MLTRTIQGCELFNLSYVDPDNRREVDYEFRDSLLKQLINKEQDPELFLFLKANRHKGTEKLFIIHKLLMLRKRCPEVFLNGDYVSMMVTSKHRENVFAYLRKTEQYCVMVIIDMSLNNKMYNQKDVTLLLPEGLSSSWINVFTGKSVTITNQLPVTYFSEFPVAVFEMSR
jgi:(1->4)-alpha-D-glucan 1-alpha-D-glucosylmutase